MDHSEIWNAIDRLAAGAGYSPSGLARQAGLDPTAFNKSKRVSADGKPRWPTTESIAKILAVTGSTMADFVGLMEGGGRSAPDSPQTIPVLSLSQAAKKSAFDAEGRPAGKDWRGVAFPGGGDPQALFALEVEDDSLMPVYRAGDVLVLAPGAAVRRGDRVAVRTKKGKIEIGVLARRATGAIELSPLVPGSGKAQKKRSLPAAEALWTARILWAGG